MSQEINNSIQSEENKNKSNPNPSIERESNAEEVARPDGGGSHTQDALADYMDLEAEGTRSAGNVAASDEEDTFRLDGSNANNLRTK